MSIESALGLGNRKRQSVPSVRGFMHNVFSRNPLPTMLRTPVHGPVRMTNQQFMRTRPSLSMRMRDSDGDGVPNWLDCRPFDRKRQMVLDESQTGGFDKQKSLGRYFKKHYVFKKKIMPENRQGAFFVIEKPIDEEEESK